MNSFLILIFTVGISLCDPNVFPLKKYSAGVGIQFDGIDTGAKLYLASNDDQTLLRQITVTSGSVSLTLDKLNDFNTDGTPKFLNCTSGLFLKTNNNDTMTQLLTGYLYVTSRQQANDPSFAVYVITGSHSISRSGMKTTTVILNTKLNVDFPEYDQPAKTSYVTNIDHSPNTNLYMNWGIPASNWLEVNDNQFFRNPLMLANYDNDGNITSYTRKFFDHVEPLQIGLDYWYFLAMGPVNMQIENKYVSNHNYMNTASNTTGLVVNNFLYNTHVVNFQWDYTRKSTVGTLISAFLTANVSFVLANDYSIASQTYGRGDLNQALMTTYFAADTLTINSTNLLPGTFYCQYFGFNGDILPLTTGPTTVRTTSPTQKNTVPWITTTTVATTTKSSRSQSTIAVLILICVLFSCLITK